MSKRRHKYNAQKTVAFGRTFDSKREAERYGELQLLSRAGKISALECQVQYQFETQALGKLVYPSGRHVCYVVDFRYFDHELDRMVVEDVKGMDTALSKLKRALMSWVYDIDVKVVR